MRVNYEKTIKLYDTGLDAEMARGTFLGANKSDAEEFNLYCLESILDSMCVIDVVDVEKCISEKAFRFI